MKKFPSFLFIFTTILIYASGQNQVPSNPIPLKINQTVEKELTSGLPHNYQISLKKGKFLYGILHQKGIDVIISLYSPDGALLKEFDSPNGTQGPEPIYYESEKSGSYLLEVEALDKEAKPGRYQLKIETIRKAAKTPEGKIDQIMIPWDRPGTPGASVAVVKDGKVIFKKGYGLANLEYNISNETSTVFHIASVSKQFTCFAVALLADQGKLSLEDDIRKYLPEVPDFGKKITIRHLANHTSGLRDQWDLLALAGWRLDDVITKEHVFKLVSNQKELNFDPGEEYLYCNTGYTLLAEIVERVSAKSFTDWCDQNIFRPLGMNRTLFYADHEKIVPNRAYSYGPGRESEFEKRVLSYANVGATSLFTTVEDLSRWALNFEDIKVGNKFIMEQMHQRGILNNGDTISYALGQVIGDYKGLNMVSHGGADAGYRSFLGRFPEQGFAIVVLSNLSSFNPGEIGLQIADIYLADQLKEDKPAPEKKENITKEFEIDPADYEDYAGQYELAPGFVLTLNREGDKLWGQATGQQKVELFAAKRDSFYLKAVEAQLSFQRDEDGKIHQLTLYQGGMKMTAPIMKSFDMDNVNLEVFSGDYYSEELGTVYSMVVEDKKLIARHRRHEDIHLQPTKENEFRGNRWFFGVAKFDRNDQGEIIGFKVSSGRVRDLRFSKAEN